MLSDDYFKRSKNCDKYAEHFKKHGDYPIYEPITIKSEEFSADWIRCNDNHLESPILINGLDKLDLQLPSRCENMHDCFQQVVRSVGPSSKIKIIEVKQSILIILSWIYLYYKIHVLRLGNKLK